MEYDDKITAFVVVYNEYMRINTCLASLFGQADEILLFDDGSTENVNELLNCYDHWKNIFKSCDCDLRIFRKDHRGSHSMYYPDVMAEASHKWLFQLDGDEIFKHPNVHNPFGYLKGCINCAYINGASGVTGIRVNITQVGNSFIIKSKEPKTRLYNREHGFFPKGRHSVEWVSTGKLVANNDFIINHVRTEEEMEKDARMYFGRTLKAYQEAKEDADKKYYYDVFFRQNEFYKWGHKSIEEAIECHKLDVSHPALKCGGPLAVKIMEGRDSYSECESPKWGNNL